MLKEVSREEWINIISEKATSVFDDPSYLEIVAKYHKTKLKYWVFFRNSKSLLGFAAHHKGKRIVVPDHFSYSSFWWDDGLGDYAFFDITDLTIKELKKKVKFFAFRLPPNVKDIRGFNLNGCSAEVRFTYIRDTKSSEIRNDIKRKQRKIKLLNTNLFYDQHYEDVLKQQLNDFKIFEITKKYESYFNKMIIKGHIKSFGVNLGDYVKASSLVLIDFKMSIAYNLLFSCSKENHDELSTFLYLGILRELSKKGINKFDFYGANIKSIARYKSGFKGDLANYFIVSFSLKDYLRQNIKDKFIIYLKKLLKKLRLT